MTTKHKYAFIGDLAKLAAEYKAKGVAGNAQDKEETDEYAAMIDWLISQITSVETTEIKKLP